MDEVYLLVGVRFAKWLLLLLAKKLFLIKLSVWLATWGIIYAAGTITEQRVTVLFKKLFTPSFIACYEMD